MKGVIKKCGLLLALPIMLGLSCVISSDVNALSYQVDKIPLMVPSTSNSFPNSLISPPAMTVRVSGNYYPSDHLYDQSQLSQYLLFLDGDSEGCRATDFRHLPILSSNSSGTINTLSYSFTGFNPSWPFYSKLTGASSNPCSSSSPPSISTSSITSLSPADPFLQSQLLGLRPYRYSYDGFYLRDTYDKDGLHYDTKFDLLYNLFGSSDNVPDRIFEVQIPLGAAEFDIPSDTPLSVSGEFIFDFDDPSVSVLSSETSLKFGIYVQQSGGGSYTYSVPCSYHLKRDDPSDSTSPWSFSYICNSTVRSNDGNVYIPSTDIVIPYLVFTPAYLSDDINPFYQFIFDSTVVITDNDDTPASTSWNTTSISGSNPHLAPGSAYQNAISGQDPDYDSSLTDMFSFGFLNPFAPIFNLFSDQNSCAQIPTIAGMIHSNETQVCPWFDSNTRNIVTPVLGLSSMMLIFGFAVRWLGGGSGNMFIDDDIKDTGHNFSLFNKYKRR